jgi:hypothetical protein
VSGFAWFWFLLSLLQVGVAFYALLAALHWRGVRLWPTAAAPFGLLRWGSVAALMGLVGGLLWRVGDVEFTRWVGTGSLMLAALLVISVLMLRVRSEEADRRREALRTTTHRRLVPPRTARSSEAADGASDDGDAG